MNTATCVIANAAFTLLEDYPFEDGEYSWHVLSDNGDWWVVHDEGDGYYGCIDINGKHVSFLVE